MAAGLDHPSRTAPRRPATAGARAGHVVAALVNLVLLWVSHQLLAWGWPAFLTEDFERVLGVVTASLVASIVAEVLQVASPTWALHRLADVVSGAFTVVVGLRMWTVFPFDFTGYATDWSTFVRVVIGVGIVGAGIAVVVNLVRLLLGPGSVERRGAR